MSHLRSDRSAIQSLKLSPAEIRKVMDALNRRGGTAPNGRQRRMRVPFENPNVVIECDDGSSNRVRYQVIARNLSTCGIAFIHGQFMHAGRRCTVEIPTLESGPPFRVEGRVERCRLIAGRVHELSIVFAQAINLSKFVVLDSMSEMRAREETRAASASGTDAGTSVDGKLLLVDDFDSNRKLYAFWLTRLGLQVHEGSGAKEALVLAGKENFRLMLVDELLGEELGSDVIRKLRDDGVTTQIISISAENTDSVRQRCMNAGADVFLPKPFERDLLQRTVVESLQSEESCAPPDEALHSEITDPDMKPLIEDFVRSLKPILESVANAAKQKELDTLRQILRSLPEAATGYGFPQLGEAAMQTSRLLNIRETRPIDLRRSIDRLSTTASRCAA